MPYLQASGLTALTMRTKTAICELCPSAGSMSPSAAGAVARGRGLVWAPSVREADLSSLPVPGNRAAGGRRDAMSTRDKAKNTAQAAKGKAKRAAGKTTGNPATQAAGSTDKKKADLKQAGEKLKDTAKK